MQGSKGLEEELDTIHPESIASKQFYVTILYSKQLKSEILSLGFWLIKTSHF